MSSNHTYTLLEAPEFRRSQGVCLSNDRDDVNTGREATHELDVHFSQAIAKEVSRILQYKFKHTNVQWGG